MQEPPMTPEAKAALMQFVGQTYGQMNKQDQMIVGQSGNLQPKSDQLRQTFESVAKMPTAQMPQQAPVPQEPLPQSNDNQLDFDFTEPSKIDKMVDLLEKQNLILKEISLKLDNGKKVKINKQR